MRIQREHSEFGNDALSAFESGQIEKAGFLFWLDTWMNPCYMSLHNYGVYLMDHVSYCPMGNHSYLSGIHRSMSSALRRLLKARQYDATQWNNTIAIGDTYCMMCKYSKAICFYAMAYDVSKNNYQQAYAMAKKGVAFMYIGSYCNANDSFYKARELSIDPVFRIFCQYSRVLCDALSTQCDMEKYLLFQKELHDLQEVHYAELDTSGKDDVDLIVIASLSIAYFYRDFDEVIEIANHYPCYMFTELERRLIAEAKRFFAEEDSVQHSHLQQSIASVKADFIASIPFRLFAVNCYN